MCAQPRATVQHFSQNHMFTIHNLIHYRSFQPNHFTAVETHISPKNMLMHPRISMPRTTSERADRTKSFPTPRGCNLGDAAKNEFPKEIKTLFSRWLGYVGLAKDWQTLSHRIYIFAYDACSCCILHIAYLYIYTRVIVCSVAAFSFFCDALCCDFYSV